MSIGSAIRNLRRDRGWTIARLAEGIGFSRDYLWKVETGRSHPSLQFVQAVADCFGVPVGALLGGGSGDLAHLPVDVAAFVTREESLPYLLLAKEMGEAQLAPEAVRSLLAAAGRLLRGEQAPAGE